MFRLLTLGGLQLEGPTLGDAVGIGQPRPLAILAILAAHEPQGVARDKLIGLLWPDRTDERARHVLSQSLYALRRGLNAEDLLLSNGLLRPNPLVISSDVADFEQALRHRDDEKAIALHAGPFLDGFYLSGLPEFEQWVTSVRARLAAGYAAALERRATACLGAGEVAGAAELWQRRVTLDPLDSRAVLHLMVALDAAGDQASAIRTGDGHNELRQQELGASPDADIANLLAELRKGRAKRRGTWAPRNSERVLSPSPMPAADDRLPRLSPASSIAPVAATPPIGSSRGAPSRARLVAGLLLGACALAAGVLTFVERRGTALVPVAVGHIRDRVSNDSAHLASALPDLLATNLARVQGMDVVSRARLYELTDGATAARDTGAAFAAAARAAGARELIEGSVYRAGDRLRLDLQRVDLGSGRIIHSYAVEEIDAASLVARTTEILAEAYDRVPPAAALGGASSVSVIGRSFYEEGLRAYYVADLVSAHRLFSAALAADSTSAMAAHYLALTMVASGENAQANVALAQRLAARATDRERLVILHHWAEQETDPRASAYAESLSTRYPSEPDGMLAAARARVNDGHFLDAVRRLRALARTEVNTEARPAAIGCRMCEVRGWLVVALELADSLPAAEQIVRAQLAAHADEGATWGLLGTLLARQGLSGAADSAFTREFALTGGSGAPPWRPSLSMRTGDFASSDQQLRAMVDGGIGVGRARALEQLSAVLRNRGQTRNAVEIAHQLQQEAPAGEASRDPFSRLPLALSLMYGGRAREAAAQFDTMAGLSPFRAPSRAARHRAWMMAHRAHALAIAGDTGALPLLADSIRIVGARSAYARDQRLYHYVRGLHASARADWPAAVRELRLAQYSSTETYLATPLARAELATGDARSAANTAAAALRGPLDSQNQYELRSELHEVLADALLAIGDSAASARQYQITALAWEGADPPFAQRGRNAREKWRRLTVNLSAREKPRTSRATSPPPPRTTARLR
jgi:DNA-binding SARP family transcriptional activator/TolB-like protein